MTGQEIMDIVKAAIKIDIKALLEALLLPMLEEFVKNTKNPYDDKLLEWFKAFLEEKAKDVHP